MPYVTKNFFTKTEDEVTLLEKKGIPESIPFSVIFNDVCTNRYYLPSIFLNSPSMVL